MKTMMMFGRGIRRCEECGNQAKKDCVYMRCRTCCKSKGFDCQTHVNSTWVPAYRRSRNSYSHSTVTHSHHHHTKRLRTHENPTTSSSLTTELDGKFPGEIRSTATTFRCVRVSSMMDDMVVREYAYEASVSIGGHLFKGILYDQGPGDIVQYQHQTTAASTSSASVPSSMFPLNTFMPNFSETLNLN